MDLKTKMYLEAVLKIPFLLQKKPDGAFDMLCPTNQCSPKKIIMFHTKVSLPSNSITLPGTIKHIISL